MNQENTDLLKTTYPTIFDERFYFECGDGWVDLISEVAKFIIDKKADCQASQVKEKFGMLRFYIDCGHGIREPDYVEIASFISAIERQSAHICETCGVKLDEYNRSKNKSYWIKNICIKCRHKEELDEEERLAKISANRSGEH